MTITLVLLLFLPGGEIKFMQEAPMKTVEQCVTTALRVNQDQEIPFSAFCHYNIKQDDQKRL